MLNQSAESEGIVSGKTKVNSARNRTIDVESDRTAIVREARNISTRSTTAAQPR